MSKPFYITATIWHYREDCDDPDEEDVEITEAEEVAEFNSAEEAGRHIDVLKAALVMASELRDYGKTVERLNRELARQKELYQSAGQVSEQRRTELAEAKATLLKADKLSKIAAACKLENTLEYLEYLQSAIVEFQPEVAGLLEKP